MIPGPEQLGALARQRHKELLIPSTSRNAIYLNELDRRRRYRPITVFRSVLNHVLPRRRQPADILTTEHFTAETQFAPTSDLGLNGNSLLDRIFDGIVVYELGDVARRNRLG